MRLVVLISVVPGSWRENEKVDISLQSWEMGTKPPGPVARSSNNRILLSMKKHAQTTSDTISRALVDRAWEKMQVKFINFKIFGICQMGAKNRK